MEQPLPAPTTSAALLHGENAVRQQLHAVQQELDQLRSRYGEAEYMLLEKDRAIMDLRATIRRQAPLVEKALATQVYPQPPPPPPVAPPPPPAI